MKRQTTSPAPTITKLSKKIGDIQLDIHIHSSGCYFIIAIIRKPIKIEIQAYLPSNPIPTRTEKRQAIALLLDMAEMAMARDGK
jgi:hypothetical protein